MTLIELVQTFRLGSTLISLILRRGQLVFQVFDCLAHVSLPRLHLALIDLRLLRRFLFLHGLSFVDLSDELLFLQGQLLSFELDDLEFLLVLAAQLSELEFALPELVRLQLIFFIYGHDLLQFALLSRKVRHQGPILADQGSVFSLCLVESDALVFLSLSQLSQVHIETFEVLALFVLQLL